MSEKKTRDLIRERADGLCERCGGGFGQTTVHHRVKRSQGGPWSASNCVALCGHGTAGCHGWAEANPNLAHFHGFHVRPWENPKTVPVDSIHGRVLLRDDGTTEPAPGDI